MKKKKSKEAEPKVDYEALLNKINKAMEKQDSEMQKMLSDLGHPCHMVFHFMNLSKNFFLELVKIKKDLSVFEYEIISTLFDTYSQITETAQTMKPINIELDIDKNLQNKSEIEHQHLMNLVDSFADYIFNANNLIKLLKQFQSVKNKLINLYPELAEFNSEIN